MDKIIVDEVKRYLRFTFGHCAFRLSKNRMILTVTIDTNHTPDDLRKVVKHDHIEKLLSFNKPHFRIVLK